MPTENLQYRMMLAALPAVFGIVTLPLTVVQDHQQVVRDESGRSWTDSTGLTFTTVYTGFPGDSYHAPTELDGTGPW